MKTKKYREVLQDFELNGKVYTKGQFILESELLNESKTLNEAQSEELKVKISPHSLDLLLS